MPTVRILNRGAVVDCRDDDTILDAALAAGIEYPFGCHSGNCGACKTRLIMGDVELGSHSLLALSADERSQGLILACRSKPRTNCIVRYQEDSEAPHHPLHTLEAVVTAAERATHDIVILRVAVPDPEAFVFSAGQFASLTFRGAPARDYSMANRPGDQPLCFHVRHIQNGIVSSLAHRADIVGQRVTIRGPYGTSYLRQKHQGPILAVAGGSGLAPIASIVGTALQIGMRQDIVLYFGARDERDLYLVDYFEGLSRQYANFRYFLVLSQPSGDTHRRTGFLADAIASDFTDLRGWKAYLAGPPVMVETVSRQLAAQGLQDSDCHADPFFTAGDTVQPTAAG